jgi:hypothetical protein
LFSSSAVYSSTTKREPSKEAVTRILILIDDEQNPVVNAGEFKESVSERLSLQPIEW